VARGKSDIIQMLLDILGETKSRYCLIGGLAVNAYVEPVVSLDLDIVTAIDDVEAVCAAATRKGMRLDRFEHSVNLSIEGSDLRVQIQTDPRYQDFISDATEREVLGYKMRVARLEDILRGKVWAYADAARRRSKRQKDLADILRIIETFPSLETGLPQTLRDELKEK
jgi:hypothetical protein